MKKILSFIFVLLMSTATHNVNADDTDFLTLSDPTFLDNSLEFMGENWGKITTVTLLATVIWDHYENDSRMINSIHKFLNDVFGFSATQAEIFVKNHPVVAIAAFISTDMLLHDDYEYTFTHAIPQTVAAAIENLHNAFHNIKNQFSSKNKKSYI